MLKEYQMFIDGKWVSSVNNTTFLSVNPADGKEWAIFQEAEEDDVNLAIEAAEKAFNSPEWSNLTVKDRSELLWKLAQLLKDEKNLEKIAYVETMDWGRPYHQSVNAVSIAYDYVAYFAGAVDKFNGSVNNVEDNSIFNYAVREPLGVVAAIIPWNAPTIMAIYKIIPATTMGNTIVIKPSECCSAPLLEFVELFKKAGFPDGVVNVITGARKAGEKLIGDARIRKVAFTGSIETGISIAKSAANHLVPGTFELGGKSPNIIFEDANFEEAVKYASLMFKNTGQTCVAPSRLLVQRSIYDKFIDRLVEVCKQYKIGNTFNSDTDLGPIATKAQYDKILKYIEIGKSEGATIALSEKDFNKSDVDPNGFYLYPTIFINVNNEMRIAQEEVFGPVLSVIPFDSEEEAIEIANGTKYGLAAAIWTENINRAHKLAKKIKAGTVWINLYHWFSVRTSFGGYKMSGYGRECGMEVLKEYSQLKNIIIKLR